MVQVFSARTEYDANGQPTTQNDLYLDSTGDLAIVDGVTAIKEACQHAAQALQGEMIFDTQRGIPNFQLIWKGVPNLLQYQSALRQAFLAIEGVVDVVSLRVSMSSSVLKYTAVIRTIYGGSTLSG